MKFSIITPSYNQGEYLQQTINSVVEQDYPDFEYFIFDGGSSDNSIAIIQECAKKYPGKINWQSKKDKGQVDAINQGFQKSKGDIVAWINSDDYYLPHSFKIVSDYFSSHSDCQWLIGNCDVTQPSLRWTFFIKHLIPYNHFPQLLYLFDWHNQPAVFLKKELIEKVGKLDEKYQLAFDYDYWLRCLKFAKPHKINQSLSVFRIHNKSKGNTKYHQQFEEDYQVVSKYTNNLFYLFLHKINQKITLLFYSFLK